VAWPRKTASGGDPSRAGPWSARPGVSYLGVFGRSGWSAEGFGSPSLLVDRQEVGGADFRQCAPEPADAEIADPFLILPRVSRLLRRFTPVEVCRGYVDDVAGPGRRRLAMQFPRGTSRQFT